MPARIIWSLVVATLIAATFVAASLFVGGDRRVLVIGETTDAHHRLEMSCETCHGAPSFADAAEAVQPSTKPAVTVTTTNWMMPTTAIRTVNSAIP